MKKRDYDFSGYATKNDLLCSDGRVIRKDAFKNCDGKVVPLVWNHGGRTDPSEIIGHALLENREDGVYAYGYFNDSEKAQTVKSCVNHGDITGLSIYANSLKQKGSDVLHGAIRELSLVLIGANPGATIDFVMQHDGESLDSFFYYLNGDECEFQNNEYAISHADGDAEDATEETDVEKVLKALTKEQKEAVLVLIAAALQKEGLIDDTDDEVQHADDEDEEEAAETREKTLKVLDNLTKEQKAAVLALVETLVEDAKEQANVKHSDDEDDYEEEYEDDSESEDESEDDYEDEEGEDEDYEESGIPANELLKEDDVNSTEQLKEGANMKHNAYETTENTVMADYRGAVQAAINEIAKTKSGKLSDAVLRHSEEYGIDEDSLAHAYPVDEFNKEITYGVANIHHLFPDAKAVGDPAFVQRDQEWVSKFLGATHHSPFSRVKSLYFDITADEARAKGYVKGTKKADEVIVLLKRKTEPTTVYKKQKLDRDDKLDVANSFDIVGMMRKELSVMLDEEVARAGMIGDGRGPADPDKISELNIRPIYNDDDVYSIKVTVTVPSDATESEIAAAVIKACIKQRKEYKGSGRPMFFIDPDLLADMLLMEDGIGRSLYPTETELATKLRVSELVEVPIFENVTRQKNGKTLKLGGIIINPTDYTYGTDKGGEKTMLDGFDIDYNQEKYLLETRCSGAMTRPYSAMVVEIDPSGDPIHA